MRVTSYGLFWRSDEIDWHPGSGKRRAFRLLGRIGAQRSTIRVADFRTQQGIYILYDNYGPAYVGLTRKLGLGARLKNHLEDHLEGKWDRFSWFGFQDLKDSADSQGILELKRSRANLANDTNTTIGDLEALIINVIDPKLNSSRMKFDEAEEWTQIELDECEKYLRRLQI